jgi:hypothetical protein
MTLRLNGSTSGYTEIDAPAVAGSNTLVLPTGNGTSGQVLQTNGSGALSWADRMTAAGPAFSAVANSSTSLSASVWTKLTLGSEEFDTNNNFASSRFSPTVAGYYQFSAAFGTDSNAAQDLWISIYKNGAAAKLGPLWRTVLGVGGVIQVSALLYLNGSTDYCEAYAYTSVTTTATANATLTYFQGFLARPA